MTTLAVSWWDAVRLDPLAAAMAGIVLIAVTIALALLLRALLRHSRSLRHQVLAVLLSALTVGGVAAVAAAELMVLDEGELGTVLGILVLTALFSVALVTVASAPLGRDARRLEATVRRIESGDRTVRTGIARADELGHVARALDELVARLDRLEQERAANETERINLLTNIGHDLRTPLAALRAALEALADGIAPDPDRYLRSMQRDVDALAGLIDDLFLLSRLEAGRLELHPVPIDLAELADEAVEALAPAAAARGVHLVLDASGAVPVSGNATAVARVIRNLLDNALRFAPEGSQVQVAVDSDPLPTIRVIDGGPGFPAGFAPRAFERFTRPDDHRSRSSGGTGLGLAIARGLVEAQGGRIWIEDPPGGRVAFQLPAA
ncbi:MAG TPA: HAMP domain-containing sensor histidine kinase [Acidimicrobiales bacterium]